MSSDDLGDRMKNLEGYETSRRFLPGLPVYARIDGRGFSKFTKGMDRPFDRKLSSTMIDTTKKLVKDTHATIGYTQSDEISLVWLEPDWFDGKIMKMSSVLAGLTTIAFANAMRSHYHMSKVEQLLEKHPHFDARVMTMPSLVEAANMLLWRNLDATKNSISMAASHYYSHKELHGKNGSDKNEMLFQKGVNFNDYPPFFKRGTWVRRRNVERFFTPEELDAILVQHRPGPNEKVIRTEIFEFDLPPLNKVSNRIDVLFDGADPINME